MSVPKRRDAPTIKLGRQFRSAKVDRSAVDVEKRTVELAFSSETPVDRWFGKEVLGHGPGECNLDWISSGRAPYLADHNTRQQIGVVERAWIGNDLVARALVRYGTSPQADQELKDCAAGIRVNVSVGYSIDELTLVGSNGEPDEENADPIYRAKWTPWEISVVSIPADTAVGVGREAGEDVREVPVVNVNPPSNQRENQNMETEAQKAERLAREQADRERQERERQTQANADTVRTDATRIERERVREITALATRHNKRDLGEKHIAEGTSLELFRGVLLGVIEPGKPLDTPATELGMSAKEARSYSVVRMLHARAVPGADVKALAPFELECAVEVEKRVGIAPKGFFVPLDVQRSPMLGHNGGPLMMARDMVVGTASAGGNFVATDLRPQDFITLLRNAMMVRNMGATILGGLVGNVAIPKQTGAGTAYWLAESGAPTESQQTVAQVALSPKTVGAFTDYSRQLLKQSSLDVENFVRTDLTQVLGLAGDVAALHGTGASNQPTGIAATGGIGSVAGGTNGAAPTWANIVDLETQVANVNAVAGAMGYLFNSRTRGKLKTTLKNPAGTDSGYIWPDSQAVPAPGMSGMVNGYKVGVSNQVSNTLVKGSSGSVCSALFFGNWADLLIGEWGVLDLMVNPYTGADSGTVRIHAFMSMDIAVRRAGSFSAMLDALAG